jgi:hypothetical protein
MGDLGNLGGFVKNHKLAKCLRDSNERLMENSWDVYHKLLSKLFVSHKDNQACQTLNGFLRNREYDKMLAFADSLSGQKYPDATEHFVANQIALLIRKYPFPKGSINVDPEGLAYKKFLATERKCARMNKVFDLLQKRNPYIRQFTLMRNFIRKTIEPSPRMYQVYEACDYGNGASLGVHGDSTHVGMKISRENWSVTPGAAMHGFNAIASHAQLRELFFESRGGYFCVDPQNACKRYLARTRVVTNNKISFVPKTARVYRSIAVEPLVNGFLQKGVDNVLRSLLARIQINLKDQTRNQEMARKGSLEDSDDSFVTIDLRSASDSMSIGLIRALLPPDWYYLLDSIRSPDFEYEGIVRKYNKFCSQGNGFNFPLQTLVFTAACRASGCGIPGTDFSVYGDDIIVRKRHAAGLIKLLNKLGFSVNKDKTFLEGPFRESCGADWFGGKAVRPYTLDNALDSVENIFKFLNLTRRTDLLSHFFSGVRPYVLGLLPSQLQFFRPYPGSEDSAIDCDIAEFRSLPNIKFSQRTQSWTWLELRHQRRRAETSAGGSRRTGNTEGQRGCKVTQPGGTVQPELLTWQEVRNRVDSRRRWKSSA